MRLIIPALCVFFLALPGSTIHGQPLPSHRCGVLTLLSHYQAHPGAYPGIYRQDRRYATRPTQPGEDTRTGGLGHTYTVTPTFYNTPEGHFKIWYVTTTNDRPGAGRLDPSDADNDGIPDWVERCGEFFETSWQTEMNTLGYRPPPADFQYHAQYVAQGLDDGGDSRYDVYIQDIAPGIAGFTVPEQVISGRKVPSYIVVDNDYAGIKATLAAALDLLRATAAHELFHAVQFGYDANEEGFWLEQSAVWMEDQVFDEVNDYVTYLTGFSGFLTQPWVSLHTANGQHEFSGVLWPLYLSQRFGPGIVRSIWNFAETVQALDAMEQALQGTDSSLKAAFQEFTAWNVFTGVRAEPARFYEEGALYPLVTLKDTTSTYPFSGPTDPNNRLPAPLGANFIRFTPDPLLPGGLRIGFTGLTAGEYGVTVVGIRAAGPDTVMTVPIVSQQGIAEVYDWGSFNTLVLVVAALNRTGFTYQYTFTAEYDSSLVRPVEIEKPTLASFPNPFSVSSEAAVAIRYSVPSTGQVTLTLYNLLGQEIKTLVKGPHPAGQYTVVWDGRDDRGRRVSSGVYFCRMTVAGPAGSQAAVSRKMTFLK
jgi:hypothetical protein